MSVWTRLMAGIHPRLAVVLHDLFMVLFAWYGVHVLRYNMRPETPPEIAFFSSEALFVVLAQGVVLWQTGLYRGLWRFASHPDLINIVKSAVLGVLAIALMLFFFDRLEGTPRSVLMMYPFALVLLLSVPRFLYRQWKDSRVGELGDFTAKRVLVLGAGSAGETLIRDLQRDRQYKPVGLLDDDRKLRGAKVHGVPVLGPVEQLPEVASEVAAEMLLIAMPSIGNQQMQHVVALCEQTRIPFRTMPRLQDVVDGRYALNALKEVAIEDLLGREPIQIDWAALRQAYVGKRVLITGGGGSIGSEVCRQLARIGVKQIAVIELSEFNLYRLEREINDHFRDVSLTLILGDAGDPATVNHALGRFKPDAVFHAAAYKHVPLLQNQAREAVRNNALSTQVLLQAAKANRVQTFVMISTDKAVNPVNVMGASKRLAEMLCMADAGDTKVVTVRFGNVLNSAGSVVPLFREQIRKGGPVTVTHKDMTRYFMTIPEACQLILQASVLGEDNALFALDMGEPVSIQYLAEQMIYLAGKTPFEDIPIVFTGLRSGERLYEEVFHEQEHYQATDHPKIMRANMRAVNQVQFAQPMQHMKGAVAAFDEALVQAQLKTLVPEYDSDYVEERVAQALDAAPDSTDNIH